MEKDVKTETITSGHIGNTENHSTIIKKSIKIIPEFIPEGSFNGMKPILENSDYHVKIFSIVNGNNNNNNNALPLRNNS